MTRHAPICDPRRLIAALNAAMLAAGILAGSAAAAAPCGVHGRVIALDESGKPTGMVAEAKIEFKNSSGQGVAQTASNADGYYRVSLLPGTYFYKVTASGYKDEDEGRGMTLVLSEGYAVYNFSLVQGKNDPQKKPPESTPVDIGRLLGRVLEKTPNGKPVGIPGARIALRKSGGGLGLVRVVARRQADPADEAGGYEAVLEAGSWQASASAPGFQMVLDPKPIAVVDGKETKRDFLLTRLAPETPSNQGIKGTIRVRDPIPGRGTPSTGKRPPDQVEVSIVPLSPDTLRQSVHPQASGTYLRDLSVGTYRVVAKAEGYRPARSGPAYVFKGKYTVVNLTLVPAVKPEPPPQPLAFEGIVLERLAQDRTRPLPGAQVLIRGVGEALTAAPRGTTDKEGKVRLQVAAPGPHVALAQKPGYQPEGARVAISPRGENRAEIILEKQSPGVGSTPPVPTTPPPTPEETPPGPVDVRGSVMCADPTNSTAYRAVADAEIRWVHFKTKQIVGKVRSDSTGRFSIQLPAGGYLAFVDPPPGFDMTRVGIEVRPGIEQQRFVVTRTASAATPSPPSDVIVRGQVVYADRSDTRGLRPVPGAEIVWQRAGAGTAAQAESDGRGEFSIHLRPGDYLAIIKPPRGFMGTQENVRVYEGLGAQRFVLKRISVSRPEEPPAPTDVVVRGEVVSIERNMAIGFRAVTGAEITWHGAGTNVTEKTRSDGAGRFSIGLRPGDYQVVIKPPSGYLGTQTTVPVRAGMAPQRFSLKRISGDSTVPADDQGGTGPGSGGPIKPPPPARMTLDLRIVEWAGQRGTRSQPIAPSFKPLAGARIAIRQHGRTVATGQSDGGGSYRTQLAPGAYTIEVTRSGYPAAQSTVTLSNQNVTRQITLKRMTSDRPSGEPKPGGSEIRPKSPSGGVVPKINLPLRPKLPRPVPKSKPKNESGPF